MSLKDELEDMAAQEHAHGGIYDPDLLYSASAKTLRAVLDRSVHTDQDTGQTLWGIIYANDVRDMLKEIEE